MIEPTSSTTARNPVKTGRVQSRQSEFSELELLRLTLNQVDYGLVAVDVDTRVVQFANAPGRDALEDASDSPKKKPYDTGLCLAEGRVTACRQTDAEHLQYTLQRTRVGVRGLLSLGIGDWTCAVAAVPLPVPKRGPPPGMGMDAAPIVVPACYALLVFAKQQICDSSTRALFARERGLTNAERQVLSEVCHGMRPAEIAGKHGVAISTVRTQLRNIRIKTRSDTIGEVVQKVSVLPPMARHLSGHMTSLGFQ